MQNNTPARRAAATFRGAFRFIGWFLLAWLAASGLESLIFPVAKTEALRVASRTDDRLCIYHTVRKLRDGRPHFWVWQISDWDREGSETSITGRNVADDEPLESGETTKKGERHTYNLCFRLPKPLQGKEKALIISARAEYIVWHNLWPVSRKVGPYMIWRSDVLDWR